MKISPLLYCCSGHRTAESKIAFRISCFFQSPAIPTFSNLSLSQRSMCGKWEPISTANSIWPLSHESGCKIQFWIFKFSIFILRVFFFSFLLVFILLVFYLDNITFYIWCAILNFIFLYPSTRCWYFLYCLDFSLLNILNLEEKYLAFEVSSSKLKTNNHTDYERTKEAHAVCIHWNDKR